MASITQEDKLRLMVLDILKSKPATYFSFNDAVNSLYWGDDRCLTISKRAKRPCVEVFTLECRKPIELYDHEIVSLFEQVHSNRSRGVSDDAASRMIDSISRLGL